ncbi:MAG: substrate-binding periplasmic protein [Fervidobacterium sp.]
MYHTFTQKLLQMKKTKRFEIYRVLILMIVIFSIFFTSFFGLFSVTVYSQVLKVGFLLGEPYSFWKGVIFTGIDYDIISKVANLMGYQLDVYILPFSALDPNILKKIGIDIVAGGIHMTEERSKIFKFSIPYAQSGLAVVLAKGIKWDGNVEKVLFGVKSGATGERIVKGWIESGKKVKYKSFISNTEIVAQLILKKIDAAIFDYINGLYLSKLHGFTIHKELIYKVSLGYVIVNEELESKFNKILESLLNSYVKQTIIKYVGSGNY